MQVLVSTPTRNIDEGMSEKNLSYLLLVVNEVSLTNDVRRFVLRMSDGIDIELEFFREKLFVYVGQRTMA